MIARPPGPAPVGKNPLKLYDFYKRFTGDPMGFVGGRFERYGDVYFTVSRGDELYVMKHPDHLHQVLVTKAACFEKRQVDLEPVLGHGLLTSNGEVWRRQRRMIQPSFQKGKIDAYGAMMVSATERRIARWQDGQQMDLHTEMMSLTLDIVCKTLFDHEVTDETDTVSDAMMVLQDAAADMGFVPRWVPTPGNLRAKRALAGLDEIIFALIDRVEEATDRQDLLARLAHAADEEGRMSKKQLRDELVTMFLAGHETTSLALTWTFYLLSRHPEQRARLQAEIDQVLDGRPVTVADLERMPFTAAVIDESLRLYPPAYVLPRICSQETEIGGYTIKPGAEVVLWIWHCHHDARWFESPKSFDPDRFAEGRVHHPHAYLPFGAGSRTCIGKSFATLEARLLLVAIAQRWDLEVQPGYEPVLHPRVTLGPRAGMPIKLSARTGVASSASPSSSPRSGPASSSPDLSLGR